MFSGPYIPGPGAVLSLWEGRRTVCRTAIWIDKLDQLEIDGAGVRIVLTSSESSIHLQMSRHQLRRFVEQGDIALSEIEAVERNRLVRIVR